MLLCIRIIIFVKNKQDVKCLVIVNELYKETYPVECNARLALVDCLLYFISAFLIHFLLGETGICNECVCLCFAVPVCMSLYLL